MATSALEGMLTFSDAVEYLQQFTGGAALDVSQADIRAAVLDAYERVSQEKVWQYHLMPWRLHMQAPYSTGTITYTNSTRTCTISGGSWPSWAVFGRIKIGNIFSTIESVSSADAILSEANNPGEDVAAGTSFTLYRVRYPLPADFRAMHSLMDENRTWEQRYLNPHEWLRIERHLTQGTNRFAWTITGDPDTYSGYSIRVSGYSGSHETMDFVLLRHPRALVYSGYDPDVDHPGTVDDFGGITLTGGSTAWEAAMVGSLIRIGRGDLVTSPAPTGRRGLNPYIAQAVILTHASATEITVDTSLGLTGPLRCLVTDPVDLPRELGLSFLKCCQYQLLANRQHKDADKYWARYAAELQVALENQSLVLREMVAGGWRWSVDWGNFWWQFGNVSAS